MNWPESIMVEGPIGVGKSTLARKLSLHLNYQLFAESPEENDFLPMFYADPARYALPVQLSFLFQRHRQVEQMKQADLFHPGGWVSDFIPAKDRMFAAQNLNDTEFELYQQIYELLPLRSPAPALTIYLQAPTRVLLQRIADRDIAYESYITERYLEQTCASYLDFFHSYQDSPLLIVNAAECNLTGSEEHWQQLLQEIGASHHAPRRYFNPGGATLI